MEWQTKWTKGKQLEVKRGVRKWELYEIPNEVLEESLDMSKTFNIVK